MYKPNSWHYNHMLDPQRLNAQSIMPAYPWLISDDLNFSTTPRKIRVMQFLGVPYPQGYDMKANDDLMAQAKQIADDLKSQGIQVEPGKEIIAMIAYLQRLGKDVYAAKAPTAVITK
jgi:cytochrome c oxidase cbb3-type subunit I/II